MNNEERTYEFTRARSMEDQETYSKKESELSKGELDLLAGTYYNEYTKLPISVQKKILQIIGIHS